MELFLLKFSTCLIVFWLVYVLLLEKQQMHRFKRFYLLGSFVFALVIPQLTIIEYIEPIVQDFEVTNAFIPIEAEFLPQHIKEAPILTLETILWSIYLLGVTLFAVRFAVNLFRLYRQIVKNDKQSNHSFIYVLLKTYRIPHSFFKYIFVNQYQFENNQIPKEVRLHEETHAKQWHSLDILLLELLQIVFWFHPLVYVLKHHVKLNHEFLADDAVLQQGVATKSYQNILLQFSSNTHNQQLVSAINYSSFKKRFTVMKTQTSKTRIWLSTLLLLPILAILFYSFAEREYVEKEQSENLITENNSFLVFVEKNGNTLELRCESGCRWSHLVLEPNSEPYIINDFGFSEGNTLDTDKFAFSIEPNQSGVKLNGLKGTAWIDLAFSLPENKKQAVDQLGMTKPTANIVDEKDEKIIIVKAVNNLLYIDDKKSSIDNYVEDLNEITENWTEKDFEHTLFDLKTENCSQSFLDNLNELHKKTNHFLITVIGSKTINENNNERQGGKITSQQIATKEQVAEYNAWAKKMNSAIKKAEANSKSPYPVFNKKEFKKYYNIYKNLMSDEQRENAETWPNIPPPPPPPPTKADKSSKRKTLKEIIKETPKDAESGYEMLDNGETHYYTIIKGKKTYYNKDGYITDDKGNILPPPPPSVPEPPKAKKNVEDTPPPPSPESIEVIEKEDVPPPPPPVSTLDFIIKMAKANASFYYEGKAITSDEAIALIKKNDQLNVNAYPKSKEGKPLVYISKEPIKIDKKKKPKN